jgi:hypothetical protein
MTTISAANLIKKFNIDSNDNKATSGWTGKQWTTRVVLGAAESKKILAEVKKLSPAQQKKVLSSIAGKIDRQGKTVGKIYIQPDGAALFNKLAKSLGLNKTFDGNAAPPVVMG